MISYQDLQAACIPITYLHAFAVACVVLNVLPSAAGHRPCLDGFGLDTCIKGLTPCSLDPTFVDSKTNKRILICEKPAEFIAIKAILAECGLLARSIRIPGIGEVLLEYDGQYAPKTCRFLSLFASTYTVVSQQSSNFPTNCRNF